MYYVVILVVITPVIIVNSNYTSLFLEMETVLFLCCKESPPADAQFELKCYPILVPQKRSTAKNSADKLLNLNYNKFKRAEQCSKAKCSAIAIEKLKVSCGDTIEDSIDLGDVIQAQGKGYLRNASAYLSSEKKTKKELSNSSRSPIRNLRRDESVVFGQTTPIKKHAVIVPSANSSFVFTPTVFHPDEVELTKLDALLAQANGCFKRGTKSYRSTRTCYDTPASAEKGECLFEDERKSAFIIGASPVCGKEWQV